jgi:hypothetical protein
MTNLQRHSSRFEAIRKGHWRLYETPIEHEIRADAAEATAGWYFDQSTTAQKAAYLRALADLTGLQTPRAERAREVAKAVWFASTAQARVLSETTFEDLMRDGEVSEETSVLWDTLPAHFEFAEVA